jgi:hypothetical protein
MILLPGVFCTWTARRVNICWNRVNIFGILTDCLDRESEEEKYHTTLKREAIERQEIMQRIIKNRLEQKKRTIVV